MSEPTSIFGLPFRHWSKDCLVPYDGCTCATCRAAPVGGEGVRAHDQPRDPQQWPCSFGHHVHQTREEAVACARRRITAESDRPRKEEKPMTTRAEVYAAIDGERTYQDSRWNAETTTSEGKHTFEEWIVYIEDYLAEAKHVLSRHPAQTAQPTVANIMRKVATMCVACMEQHGAPKR